MPVRTASLTNLADLVSLSPAYLDFYEVPMPEEQVHAFLTERLRQGDSTLFSVRDAKVRALGLVQLYPLSASLASRPSRLLSNLYARLGAHCRDVGEAPMSQAWGFIESMGTCDLQLKTTKTNHAGQSLYRRFDYIRGKQFYTYWLQS